MSVIREIQFNPSNLRNQPGISYIDYIRLLVKSSSQQVRRPSIYASSRIIKVAQHQQQRVLARKYQMGQSRQLWGRTSIGSQLFQGQGMENKEMRKGPETGDVGMGLGVLE